MTCDPYLLLGLVILTSVSDSDPRKCSRIRIMDHLKDPYTNDCLLWLRCCFAGVPAWTWSWRYSWSIFPFILHVLDLCERYGECGEKARNADSQLGQLFSIFKGDSELFLEHLAIFWLHTLVQLHSSAHGETLSNFHTFLHDTQQ